ncbi:amino acid ABC transporter ATP-binding protein [Mesorhizobium sp. PUT5]|uniref:amino acid ABC transporter ATP-binding protein n=1 Tax=Mesorhizobium sp. PUT5 TaxID=3454629 RepID=UPI003FA46886
MALLEIADVRKKFGALEVLKGISLSVEEGEIIAIVGRSGSGKSTLLRCVNALESIDEGTILFDGLPVRRDMKNLRLLRQRMGIVFQSFNLFPHMNVERNVTLAPILTGKVEKSGARELALEVLNRVGLSEKIDVYPGQLSGGQQQRVAIARCLAMSPELMLFDEATSALDPELVGEVLHVIEDMARNGLTMILVTHEMGFARNVSTRVVFMNEGMVWEQGPPAELFANPKTPEFASFIRSSGQS